MTNPLANIVRHHLPPGWESRAQANIHLKSLFELHAGRDVKESEIWQAFLDRCREDTVEEMAKKLPVVEAVEANDIALTITEETHQLGD